MTIFTTPYKELATIFFNEFKSNPQTFNAHRIDEVIGAPHKVNNDTVTFTTRKKDRDNYTVVTITPYFNSDKHPTICHVSYKRIKTESDMKMTRNDITLRYHKEGNIYVTHNVLVPRDTIQHLNSVDDFTEIFRIIDIAINNE